MNMGKAQADKIPGTRTMPVRMDPVQEVPVLAWGPRFAGQSYYQYDPVTGTKSATTLPAFLPKKPEKYFLNPNTQQDENCLKKINT